MKICLISISHDILNLGMRRISSYLKLNGVEVKMIFISTAYKKLDNKGLDNLLLEIMDYDHIGLSFMSNFKGIAFQISSWIKKFTNFKIIMGGSHATNNYEECLGFCDIVIMGEGEKALLSVLKGNLDYPNIYYKKDGNIIKNELELNMEFDNLPYLDYDLDNDYIYEYGKINKLDYNLFKCYFGKVYYVMTSYGCPFRCSYCCNSKYNELFGYEKRLRDLNNVLLEIKEFKGKYPFVERIRFADDLFFIHDIKELRKFLERYKKEIGLEFDILGGYPTFITKERMDLLYKAGLVEFTFGVQSGNKKTNKIFNRLTTNEQVLKAVNVLSEYGNKGVKLKYEIITDNPWESERDRLDTINLLLKFPLPYELIIYSLTPFENTPIYDTMKQMGFNTETKRYIEYKEDYLNLCLFMLQKNIPKPLKEWIIEKRNSKISKHILILLIFWKRNISRLNLIKQTAVKFYNSIINFDTNSMKYYIKKIKNESLFWLD